jgi:hypothetical protein
LTGHSLLSCFRRSRAFRCDESGQPGKLRSREVGDDIGRPRWLPMKMDEEPQPPREAVFVVLNGKKGCG